LEDRILKFTFKGGSHVAEHKNTAECAVRKMDPPTSVSIPMSQHIGAPACPVVAPGDRVLMGQVIGEVSEGLGCPVHASVSGTVREITSRNNAAGMPVQNIVIENDGAYELHPDVKPYGKPLPECTPDELIELLRRAGISGMGGATFPTYAKLRGAIGKVQHVIINCAECEPFITANHRLMLEQPEALIGGARVLLQVLGLDKVTFAIEDNKMDAVACLKQTIATMMVDDDVTMDIAVMKTKYPQGDERQIIYALMKKEVPAGKLPADVGCILFNAETCAAVWRAYAEGMPLIWRIVTVDGDCIAQPGNLLAPVGASYADLAAACGGFVKLPEKVVNGGPMMGFAQWDLQGSVTKGTSALLYMSEEFIRPTLNHTACIHCGRCADHCPMHLMPYTLTVMARKRQFDEAQKYDIMSCVECGTCSYNCPAGVEIVQYIRAAKAAIRQKQAADRARAAGGR
jgi:electron transport complex protein RnfC